MSLLKQDIDSIVNGIIAPAPVLELRKSWSPDTYYLQIKGRPTFTVRIPGLSESVEYATNITFSKKGIHVGMRTAQYYVDGILRNIAYDIQNILQQHIPKKKQKSDPFYCWISSNLSSQLRNNTQFQDEIYGVWKWYKTPTFTKDDLSNAIELLRLIAKKHGALI